MWAKAGLEVRVLLLSFFIKDGLKESLALLLYARCSTVLQVDVRELCTMHPRTNWPKDRNNTRVFYKKSWSL